MRIQDCHAVIDGKDEEFIFSSGGIHVLANKNGVLYVVELDADGVLGVRTFGICKHNEDMFDTTIGVFPIATNYVKITRMKWRK